MNTEYSANHPLPYGLGPNELVDAYNEACSWLVKHGVNVRPTRFGRYTKHHESIMKATDEGRFRDIDQNEIEDFINATTEMYELIRIATGLESLPHSSIDSLLNKAAKGKFSRSGKNDQSRDFSFELDVGARFLKAGFFVDFRSTSDLRISDNDRTIFIECKRVKSLGQLEKRIKAAKGQLISSINRSASKKTKGIIALEVSELIDACSKDTVFFSQNILYKYIVKTIDDFIFDNENSLLKGEHKSILAVFAQATLTRMITHQSIIVPGLARTSSFYNFGTSEESYNYFKGLLSKLGNQFNR